MKFMKLKKFLSLIFVLLLFISFAQFSFARQYTVGDVLKGMKGLSNFFELFFGLTPDQPIEIAIIWLIIFIMLFFAFSDIIKLFTAFSTRTAYILGFGLALITAMTRSILFIAVWAFGITGALGVFSVIVVIISAFIAFAIIHWATGGPLLKWAIRRKIIISAMRSAEKPSAAWKKLEEFEEYTK